MIMHRRRGFDPEGPEKRVRNGVRDHRSLNKYKFQALTFDAPCGPMSEELRQVLSFCFPFFTEWVEKIEAHEVVGVSTANDSMVSTRSRLIPSHHFRTYLSNNVPRASV